jgi:trehalose-phosphatase
MRRADPSLIASDLLARCGDRHLLVLCDFDGTLVEFKTDPAAVWLPEHRRSLLRELMVRPRTTLGLVSGRRLEDVRARAGLGTDLYAAGLHGLEIEGGGAVFVHPQLENARTLVRGMTVSLAAAVQHHPGAFIEDKELSLAVHYRDVPTEAHEDIIAAFDLIVRPAVESGRLRVMHGACVLELLPDIPWNKGDAVRWIAEHAAGRLGRVFPIYFGDDVTDEDALRAVAAHGVAVASSDRVTSGEYLVDGPAGVEAVIRALLAPPPPPAIR